MGKNSFLTDILEGRIAGFFILPSLSLPVSALSQVSLVIRSKQ